jgi:LytS/YehU family sensor histidine kinase
MLLQPFVENVFVHAFTSSHSFPKLVVSFQMVALDVLECKIIDNGKGYAESKKYKNQPSRGIHLAKERLALLEGTTENTITIQHLENVGTTITIRLKVYLF